jgi:hypothetical protein
LSQIFLIQQNPSAIRFDKADEHVEAGGFAGAVGSEQTNDLALLNPQADGLHHGAATVGFGD